MNAVHRLAIVLAIALAPSCVWLEGGSSEQGSLPDQKPRTGGGDPLAGPGEPLRRDDPRAPLIRDLPTIERPRWQTITPELSLWAGGLRTAIFAWGGGSVVLHFAVAHHRIDGPAYVLAMLTARLVADAPRDGGTQASLRQRLADYGGDLQVDVDLASTHYSVALPLWRLPDAMRAFAEALSDAPKTSERVDAMRRQLASELARRWSDDPLTPAIDRVRAYELRSLPDWISALEDATAIDVGQFHHESYVPGRLVIAAGLGQSEVGKLRGEIAASFGAWLKAAGNATPMPSPLTPPASGVFWAESEGRTRLAIAFDLQPHNLPDAAAMRVATEYLAAPGGVLETAIRAAVPGLGPIGRHIAQEGARRRLDLLLDVEPAQVKLIWEATQKALDAAARQKPNAVELLAAIARARVALAAEFREPRTMVESAARIMLAGAPTDQVLGVDGQKLLDSTTKTDWSATVRALERRDGLELGPTLQAQAKRRALFVAIGGRDEAFHGDKAFVAMSGAFVSPELRDVATANSAAQEAAASELLKRAASVYSGPLPLLVVDGLRGTSTTRSGRGPEVVDVELYRADGRYRRVRNVLATTVETTIGAGPALERCGPDQRRPDPDEVASILAPLRRHPLLLLSEWSRGKARYRQVSDREIDGRRHAVLERLDDGTEPLRLFIDVESAIPRVVTYHEDRATGRVYVRDEWRSLGEIGGGMRAPLHRTTFFDDGLYGLVTRWTNFRALPPDDAMLQPGGPVR
jgi:hypothetical protein